MRIWTPPLIFTLLLALTASAGAQNVFSVAPDYEGLPGDTVASQVLFDTVDDAQGWSFGVCMDAALVDIVDAVDGATTLIVNGGGPPDFDQINILPGEGVTMGVVISFLGLHTLDPGTGHEILDMTHTVFDTAPLGTVTELCLCDTLGAPPVSTVLVVGGASITPEQNCATITLPEPPEDFLTLTCVGDIASVSLSWEWNPVNPFDYFLLHRDGELFELLDGAVGEYFDDLEILPGAHHHYSLLGIRYPDPLGSPDVLEATCDVDIVALEIDEVIGTAGFFYGGDTVTLVGLGFTSGDADPVVSFGGIPGTDVVVISDTELTVVTPAATALGTVEITAVNSIGDAVAPVGFTYGFVRGDVNCDSLVDIGDGTFLLTYLFSSGPDPCCFDAADANDDGGLDAADAIYLLAHLFSGGPVLPPPFPDPLGGVLDPADTGLDPTDDGLGCF